MRCLGVITLFCCLAYTFGDQVLVAIKADGIELRNCNDCQLYALTALIPDFCPLTQAYSTSELATVVDTAQQDNTPPFEFDQLIVCCDGTSTAGLLLDMLRYSTMNELKMEKCAQDFSPSIADFVVIYGLKKAEIISETAMDFPRNRLDLTQTDESDTTTTYQNHHVVFLYQNLFDGSKGIRGFSLIYDHTATSDLSTEMTTALQRAPTTVTSKGDNTFLASAIYGK